MAAYIVRRLIWAVFLLLAITMITFVIFYLLPSADPATLRAGKQGDAETIAEIRHQLKLDRPVTEQFYEYVKQLVLHGDFGNSYVNDAPVRELILDRIPNTIYLVLGAAFLWFVTGVTIGTISATRRGTLSDRAAMGTALLLISAPVYWLGLVAIYMFSSDIGQYPLLPGNGAYSDAHGFFGHVHVLIMPWIVLSAAFAAIYARLVRSNMLEVMSEDYIRTARSKGLKERTVIVKHGLRAAITPVITVLGLDIGILMGGAILTETVFGIPGVGRLSYDAISRGDLVTIQGTVLFLAFAVTLMNLIVDILYSVLDPRVRY
jgi:peptide/nickel transport system permease protein